MLKDRENYVKTAAARALGQLKVLSPGSLRKICKAARQGNDAALEALWEIALYKGNDRIRT